MKDLLPIRMVAKGKVEIQRQARPWSLGLFRRFKRSMKPLGGVLLATTAWQLGAIQHPHIPGLDRIISTVVDDIGAGELLHAMLDTLQIAVFGLAVAIVLGLPLGFLIALSPRMEQLTRPLFEFIRPIPSVAFVPVAIVVLGLGFATKSFVVAFATVWIVIFNTKAGVEGVDPRLVETGSALRVTGWESLVRILLPAALPAIATGVRLATSTSIIVTITSEILVGGAGLGFYIESARIVGNVNTVWAGALVAGLIGLIANGLLLSGERRLLRWSVENRDRQST